MGVVPIFPEREMIPFTRDLAAISNDQSQKVLSKKAILDKYEQAPCPP
jgi:hypothetical protein